MSSKEWRVFECAVLFTALAGAAAAADPAPEAIARSVVEDMDRSADPCADFYRYACGGWLDRAKIPADQTRWVRSFSVLRERNLEVVRAMLEDAAAQPGSEPDRRRIGFYYGSCMDEAAIESAGLEPLRPLLAEIEGVDGPRRLLAASGTLQRIGVGALLDIDVVPDFKNPELQIAFFSQGGLGMPERDYYVSEDPKKRELMREYEKHVATMLGLLGESPKDAARHAGAVLELESALARASRDAVAMRQMEKLYNKMDVAGLRKLTPGLDWPALLETLGAPDIADLNVTTPEFFEALERLVPKTPPETLRAYLRWQLVNRAAPLLPARFVEASFDFFGRTLSGQKEMRPRWKRCVDATQGALGELVGKLYVEREFPGDSKEIALEMMRDIQDSFGRSLPGLAWMDDATRARAVEKKSAIENKIGYPDFWRDYSTLQVVPKAYFANALAASRFETARQLAKVGRPVDRREWRMTPQTVNASYNPLANQITFPAGILQPPFFHRSFPAALNYGAVGTVMGHELTHGFDDQGRKFDPKGSLREWWEAPVAAKFEERAQCVKEQYSAYEVEAGVRVNGGLTLGENIADVGGLKQSYDAYKAWETRHGNAGPAVPGLTADQLFFVAHGQVWCGLTTPEEARLRVTTDVHSPPRFRVVGPIANHPAFAAAFQCKTGAPMNPAPKCEVW